jgi:hypothetical protein
MLGPCVAALEAILHDFCRMRLRMPFLAALTTFDLCLGPDFDREGFQNKT